MKMSPRDPLDRPVGDDEAEAARVRLDPADDQVHAVRQAEPVAARLNQVTGRDELLQQPLDRRPLLPGDLQALQQLPGRRRDARPCRASRTATVRCSTSCHSTFPNHRAEPRALYRPCDRDVRPPSRADLLLVRRAQAGDLDAFGELVERNRRAVFRAALAAVGSATEADDVAQEAFVTAFQKLETFRGESSFKTWLLAITWRKAIDRRKSISRWMRGWPRPGKSSGPRGAAGPVDHLAATGQSQEDALLTSTCRAAAAKADRVAAEEAARSAAAGGLRRSRLRADRRDAWRSARDGEMAHLRGKTSVEAKVGCDGIWT